MSASPEKDAPRNGDIAYYEDCVPGGDPYRVTVVWRHSKPGTTGGGVGAWYNVAGTLHPVDVTGKTLHLLVRDGRVLPPEASDAPCGKHFGRHPERPELVAICTLPAGHDDDCDNALPKSGRVLPPAEGDAS